MKTVKLIDQKRTGLFDEHAAFGVAALIYDARATIPAIELLEAAGAVVEQLTLPAVGYCITLGNTMPAGIVAVHLNEEPHLGLRLSIEPEYPGEHGDCWRQVDFTPCPVCGSPVVWYEAGYVPGYRVCSRPPHHHSLAK